MSSEAEAAVKAWRSGPPGEPSPGVSPSAAIINPTREPWDDPVSARVILTFTLPDYRYLCRLVQPRRPPRYVYNCALREGRWDDQPITLTAPALGAPYAVMVLEKLMVLGARMVLALGWCGSLQPHLKIGDLVLPTATVSTEGTSQHYPLEGQAPDPDPELYGVLRRLLSTSDHRWQEGPVWSTDGFYRETVQLVQAYQAQGSWELTWKWRPCSPWAGSGRCRWPGYWWFRMNWPPCNGTRATARSAFAGPGIRPPA